MDVLAEQPRPRRTNPNFLGLSPCRYHQEESWQRFVLWWDEQEKHKGGRPTENPSQTDDGLTAESLGVNRDTISLLQSQDEPSAHPSCPAPVGGEPCVVC